MPGVCRVAYAASPQLQTKQSLAAMRGERATWTQIETHDKIVERLRISLLQHVAADARALSKKKILAAMLARHTVQYAGHISPLIMQPTLGFQRKRSKSSSTHEQESGIASVFQPDGDNQCSYIAAAESAPVAEVRAHGRDAARGQSMPR